MGKKNDETLVPVREAIEQLRRGDTLDALTTLERCASPKWHNVGQSRHEYFSVMVSNGKSSAAHLTTAEAA